MGSSVSSDASLAGGLSLPGETHISKHPSLPAQTLHVSHSGEAELPPGGLRAVLGLLYLLCALYASIMQPAVFYLASGPFPGPPLSPFDAGTLMGERDGDVDVCKFNQEQAEETTL